MKRQDFFFHSKSGHLVTFIHIALGSLDDEMESKERERENMSDDSRVHKVLDIFGIYFQPSSTASILWDITSNTIFCSYSRLQNTHILHAAFNERGNDQRCGARKELTKLLLHAVLYVATTTTWSTSINPSSIDFNRSISDEFNLQPQQQHKSIWEAGEKVSRINFICCWIALK